MTAESSSIDVAPHWLMRLFGAQAATFSLGDKGLEVTTKNGENYLIEATSLANEATFQEGIVFSGWCCKRTAAKRCSLACARLTVNGYFSGCERTGYANWRPR